MSYRYQGRVQDILDAAVSSGEECGVQCIIRRGGETEAECYSGSMDAAGTRKVTPESVFPVFSTGKCIFSTLALKMIEKGAIGLDTPLGEVWPGFRTGVLRPKVTMRHVLTHTTGMHIMPPLASAEELSDWDLVCDRMAEMEPLWEPGTRTQYQAITYAWLLGGALVHATGRSMLDLMTKEILEPCGITNDTFFSLSEKEEARLGDIVRGDDLLPNVELHETFMNPLDNAVKLRCVRQACIPSFACVSNARGIAKFGEALADGRIISHEMIREATKLQRPKDEPIPSYDQDVYWSVFGYGYILLGNYPNLGELFGHHGWGGSELSINQRTGTVFAIVKNKLSGKVNQRMKMEIHKLADE